MNLKIWKGIYE